MPKFYVYARISHKDQEAGDSINGQKSRGQRHWSDNYQEQGFEWGGYFEEPNHVSARCVPFLRRKSGKEAAVTLQPGDILFVDKVDRLWRDIHDFSDLLRWFKSHQIALVFGNLMGATIKSDTPLGDFMLGLMVLIAKLESDQISNRTCAALDYEKQLGYTTRKPGQDPMGMKIVEAVPRVLNKKGKPKRVLTWDIDMRILMAEIVKMRDVDGMTWLQIAGALMLRFDNYVPNYEGNLTWPIARCQKAYELEKKYQFVKDPRFMDLKKILTPKPTQDEKLKLSDRKKQRARLVALKRELLGAASKVG